MCELIQLYEKLFVFQYAIYCRLQDYNVLTSLQKKNVFHCHEIIGYKYCNKTADWYILM